MRIAQSILVGSLAALILVAAPALAKNSDGQKAEDKKASVSCQRKRLPSDGLIRRISWDSCPSI